MHELAARESELLFCTLLSVKHMKDLYPCVPHTSIYTYVRVFSERQDEVVYYDTFESADDITEDDTAEREELHRLQVSARQLEARRGRITAKRSYLRNKKVCVCILLTFTLIFIPEVYPGFYILLHAIQRVECTSHFV